MTITLQVSNTANDGAKVQSDILNIDSSAFENEEIDILETIREMCNTIATATGEYEGKMGSGVRLSSKNLHGNTVTFRLNQDITHETEDGQHFPGKISAFQPENKIEILYPNGKKSTHPAATCFHG